MGQAIEPTLARWRRRGPERRGAAHGRQLLPVPRRGRHRRPGPRAPRVPGRARSERHGEAAEAVPPTAPRPRLRARTAPHGAGQREIALCRTPARPARGPVRASQPRCASAATATTSSPASSGRCTAAWARARGASQVMRATLRTAQDSVSRCSSSRAGATPSWPWAPEHPRPRPLPRDRRLEQARDNTTRAPPRHHRPCPAGTARTTCAREFSGLRRRRDPGLGN